MAQPIQPLRIQKGNALYSPTKTNGTPFPRPLAEVSSVERRRNSPSYNQANKTKMMLGGDSSPFESSPFAPNSPKAYWQNRNPVSPGRLSMENRNPFEKRDSSPSPAAKRSSIENLKRASRVKNSNMFALEQKQEYDPTSTPVVERPLASGRPLVAAQGNAFGGVGKDKQLGRNDSPYSSPSKPQSRLSDIPQSQKSPVRSQASPTKSSLSKNSRYVQAQKFDPENGLWSDDEDTADHQLPPGKSLHRYGKSVTFDAAPPQVNEYEMTTPDPSSATSGSREGSYESADDGEDESFDLGSSIDHDDSFDASLEDTDKTPVVLPEDWRFMSPDVANDTLAARVEDPFDGNDSSPAPTANPGSVQNPRSSPTRTDSVNSNGERRPLPPLPALDAPMFPRPRSDSNSSLSKVATRVSNSQRVLLSPPRPSSLSKADIQEMKGHSMSIEDRLRLMIELENPNISKDIHNTGEFKTGQEQTEESTKQDVSESGLGIKIHEDETADDTAGLGEYKLPPRISRESILRKVKVQSNYVRNDEYDYSSPPPSSSPERQKDGTVDPDIPLPSLEGRFETLDFEETITIKQEYDDEVDVYAIPELYQQAVQLESQIGQARAFDGSYSFQDDHSVSAYDDDDDASHYSNDTAGVVPQEAHSHSMSEDDGPPTPRAITPVQAKKEAEDKSSRRISLLQFASMLGEDDFGLSLGPYMTPSPPLADNAVKQEETQALVTEPVQRPITPEEQLYPPRFSAYGNVIEDEPKTPDSVIRHSIASFSPPESPGISEPVATIKAPGTGLKTRPSISPADVQSMAETRRHVSAQHPTEPTIAESAEDEASSQECDEGDSSRNTKRKSSLVQLEVPVEELDEGLSFGLFKEFDRVIDAQKKGYLMRQNTKVVVASSNANEAGFDNGDVHGPTARGTRSAGNSPRKPSQQTWTTEPWNGKIRRKSIRQSTGTQQKKPVAGPVPPLPGQQSNVTNGLGSVAEDQSAFATDDFEEGTERGRLFVKVVGVKDLDLPLPRGQSSGVSPEIAHKLTIFLGERSYFALTLDNGLHCVTTAWLELGKQAPIGQEFELVVLDDLEFQLTLQTKLEEPKPKKIVESPTKAVKTPKQSTFSRVFASPKKRKEMELRQKEEAEAAAKQRQLDAQAKSRAAQPTAWDLLHNLVAKDGSFARSYVCLKDHESQAYGAPYVVDVPCFNEWAMEEVKTVNSVKSGRTTPGGRITPASGRVTPASGFQRRAPYKIGKLELQLLYVPKPKGARDEDMPKSMNACIRELQEAEMATEKSWEGHLSQQGGDCPYWRRRFFRLEGSKLTAYHEATLQPRATINLAKASKLIDDKPALTQKEVSGKGGARRKSAFAEEEEGYMFVEEGFRIRFANGETIDFYADSAAEKDGWMRVLAEVVGKDFNKPKSWTDLVLAYRKALAQRAARAGHSQRGLSHNMRGAPSTPGQRKASQNSQGPPPPVEKDARHRRDPVQERKQKTRSMVF
ncbi:MAG: Bud site selection protein bud4 [Icmadophila ericetorum]|nr:Bud site selection protein bud4 [Icmadophila ericetorum]